MLKNIGKIGVLLLITSKLIAIQLYEVGGFEVFCKTSQDARLVGDFPIQNPLQFQYTTQDNYSCLVSLSEATLQETKKATVVVMSFDERYQHDPLTRKTKAFALTPNDIGIPGNFEFMYLTRGPKGEHLYGFVDYGNNDGLQNFLQILKQSRHSTDVEEKKFLGLKTPATYKTLATFGAKISK